MDFPNPFDQLPDWVKGLQNVPGIGGMLNPGLPGAGIAMPRIRQALSQVPGGPGAAPGVPAFGNAPAAGALGTNQPQGTVGQYNGLQGQSFGPMLPGTMPGNTGTAGAAPAAPGGFGPQNLDPLNLIQNPRTGVLLKLQEKGISPYSGDPIVKALLKRAGDITNTVLPQLAGSTDPVQTLLQGLSAAIDRAFSGQQVFYGDGGGDALGAINSARGRTEGGMSSAGDRILANLASDPDVLAKLLTDLSFAGQGSAFSNVAGEQLGNQAALFAQNRLQDPTNTPTSFLDAILQQRLPSFRGRERSSLTPGVY